MLAREALMKIDVRNLSADNELRKLLGKSFGRAMDADQRINPANNRFYRPVRSRLVKANPNWPPLSQIGSHYK